MTLWDDGGEVDPEYVEQQRAARAKSDRPKGTMHTAVQSKPGSATATAKRKRVQTAAITQNDLSPVKAKPEPMICNGHSVVRHARDHEDESLRGQPILDEDGRRQYRPCEAPAMKGQTKCVAHGGKTPAAIKRAEEQLQEARNYLMERLLRIGLDETLSPKTAMDAIKWALERAGFRGGQEISVETPGWQRLLQGLFERDDPSTQDDVVEAEVVEPTPLSIAELRAAMGQQPEKYEPAPTLTPEQMANYTPSDSTPPASWGLKRGRR